MKRIIIFKKSSRGDVIPTNPTEITQSRQETVTNFNAINEDLKRVFRITLSIFFFLIRKTRTLSRATKNNNIHENKITKPNKQ